MLKLLAIKDFALIEKLNVHFDKGLNIITGETGAGKSIILDALGLILGDRASIDMVRKGANKTVIEAFFDISGNTKIKNYLDMLEIEYEDELIVRREVSTKGNSRCFLNDIPTTINNLKEAGNFLVDLHGQHEHQSLLNVAYHIKILDEFASLQKQIDEKGLKNISIIQPNEKTLTNALQEVNDGKKLWKLFLILALIFLAAEILIIRLFK